jgi:hypothetical protein
MEGAGNYVDSTAWHCYADPLDWTVLSDFHNSYPTKNVGLTIPKRLSLADALVAIYD